MACTGVLIIGHYFEKYRALANAIAMCGTGTGTILIAQIVPYFNEFTLKKKLEALSVVFLIALVPLVTLLRPLKPTKIQLANPIVNPDYESSVTSSSEMKSGILTYADMIYPNLRHSTNSFSTRSKLIFIKL